MGWFDEQIEERKKQERELLAESLEKISCAVTGKHTTSNLAEGADVNDAIANLLAYFHIKEKEVPPKIKDLQGRLDYLLSSTGVLYREINLTPGWHRDAMGAMIGTLTDVNAVVTLLPGKSGGYEFVDPQTGKVVRVNHQNEKRLGQEALCFYRPMPQRKMKLKDLFLYMGECLTVWDFLSFGLAALAVTLVGLIIPKLNLLLMGQVVDSGSHQLLFAVMSFMLFATLGSLAFSTVQSLLLSRINVKMNTSVRAAAMMRVLALPASFFKNYSAGELNQYLAYLNNLCETLANSVLSTGITGIFSLIYLGQIFTYAKSLVLPSLVITVLTLTISLITTAMQSKISKKSMTLSAKEKGLTYSLINGIQKIRLSGAENRAFAKWSDLYAKESTLLYRMPLPLRVSSVIISAVSLAGTVVLYYLAVRSGVTVAEYYAFNAAYAYISTAFTALTSVAMTAASIKPGLEIVRPFLDAEPELTDGLETVASLSGSLELSHLSFRYDENGPMIINDLSLNIPARQYVAIVGRSGCGKSTLVRLLLGFETPTKGAIYYDKKDTRRLDMGSVRRQIGTVMQDGKLFGGSIFDNITISAPTLKLQDAWEAAEIAGMAEDIRAMPMGMNTLLQEGSGGISGGQRQRLMIARAVAPKPKLLIFDEATSALDNITQKQVADALDTMRCTRIVIAHRLSTIRHCDRILVMDQGKIIEDGNYDELIAKNGFFAELVDRQRLDKEN